MTRAAKTRPVEIGWPTYAPAVVDRIRRQHRARIRREHTGGAWRWVPLGTIAGAAAGIGLWPELHHGAVYLAAVLVAVGIIVPYRRVSSLRTPVDRWVQWARVSRDMAQAMRRGLDADWTIFWDRRLEGIRDPVTIVVGPGGLWTFWVAAPDGLPDGTFHRVHQAVAAQFPRDVTIRLRCEAITTPAAAWKDHISQMICSPLVLSPGDCQRLAARIEHTTIPDLDTLPRS